MLIDEISPPFWRTDIQRGESLFFLEASPGLAPSASLLFRPGRVLDLSSASGLVSYDEGADYVLDPAAGVVRLTPGSRIHFEPAANLCPTAESGLPGIAHRRDDPETKLLFSEGHFFHDRQCRISYTHPNDRWTGFVPHASGANLPRTMNRLRKGLPLRICITGDSISAGANASQITNVAPYQPPYPDLVVNGLRQLFSSPVTLVNCAVGGWCTEDGLADVGRVTAAQPDLLVVAYGMNDAGNKDAGAYADNIRRLTDAVWRACGDVEIILVASMLPNPEWHALQPERFAAFRDELAAMQEIGAVLLDMTTLWGDMLRRKSFHDLTGNGVNHPNDFGHRIYAQALLALLKGDKGVRNRHARTQRRMGHAGNGQRPHLLQESRQRDYLPGCEQQKDDPMTMQRMMAAGMLMLAGFLVPVGQAWALINPNFTPMHLVNQSDTILDVRFVPVKDGVITLQIQSALKGKAGAKTLALSLKNTAFKEQAQTVEKTINESGDRPGIFFVGKISEGGGAAGGLDGPGGPGGGDEGGGEKGFLHLNGQWIAFDKDKDAWSMNEISSKMLATWNGGTDMLRKEVDYILADPDAVVPCTEGVSWGTPQKFATVAGKVRAVMPVTLADGGNQVLFLAADAGDKLFEFNATARGLKDVSAAHKLSTKSTIATWGDLNGDGRMDLVSWDGEAVSTWIQDASGVLQAGAKLAKGDIKGGCLSLAVIDSGVIGHPAVLIGTAATPLLWTPAAAAEPQVAKPVAAGEAPVKDLGATGRSFVADFDGDGFADILHLFAKGSLVYKGKAVGAFDVPKPCTVALGAGTSDAFLGDFDGDGLLDVYTLGDNTQLWNNRGKMEFVNVMQSTGEMTYKGNTDSIWGATGDINGDGRQDVVFFHGSTSPHIFFNRGFRSFGLANGIDFDTTGVIPGISEGQQAGCWTGLNGDGIQELVMILKNGEAWFLPVETGSEKAGCVRVTLSSKAPYVGPVNVVGIRGKRMLGAWNVLPGVSEGFIAQNDAGPVSIKWQLPGGKPQSKEINVENAPVKLMLP